MRLCETAVCYFLFRNIMIVIDYGYEAWKIELSIDIRETIVS